MHLLPRRPVLLIPQGAGASGPNDVNYWTVNSQAEACATQKTSGGPRRIRPETLQTSMVELRRAGEQICRIFDFDLVPVDLFLAFDAKGCPWHSVDALRGDILLAVQTYAI